jgi:hypothetical protein
MVRAAQPGAIGHADGRAFQNRARGLLDKLRMQNLVLYFAPSTDSIPIASANLRFKAQGDARATGGAADAIEA